MIKLFDLHQREKNRKRRRQGEEKKIAREIWLNV